MSLAGASPLGALLLLPKELLRCHFKLDANLVVPAHLDVCRHTYCSIQAKAGMYPKTLQYLMGHSDISVTMNTYTHLGLEDAVDEMNRMQQVESARKEQEALMGKTDEVKISKKHFRAG